MTDFDPTPREAAVEKVNNAGKKKTDTFGRVYSALLGVTESTHCPKIAEMANCSQNSAKKHLNRLVEMGLAQKDPSRTRACYRRNEGYFEWREANQIATDLTAAEIIERVHKLESQQEEFEDRFDSNDPASVSVFAQDSHEAIHDRMKAVSEWQRLKRDIRLYELAHRLAENDGHLIPV